MSDIPQMVKSQSHQNTWIGWIAFCADLYQKCLLDRHYCQEYYAICVLQHHAPPIPVPVPVAAAGSIPSPKVN
ncbi:hypothetical protein A2U01_0059470 [Trifolium medium]|uniref:Uncharacterized protein n=1 Tax=Trifolium medium TaxID=97028 RepID=A0A392RPU5_9FABA|nr:hypothetical protein [Trifolium medium]